MSQRQPVGSIDPVTLKRRLDAGEPIVLLDVREDDERACCALEVPPTAIDLHVPMGLVSARLDAIVQCAGGARQVVVYCHLGQRSAMVARWLASRGVPDLFNLEGGIDAWAVDAEPGMARY